MQRTEAHERLIAADGEFRLVHVASTFHGCIDRDGNEISVHPGQRVWLIADDANRIHERRGGVIIGRIHRHGFA